MQLLERNELYRQNTTALRGGASLKAGDGPGLLLDEMKGRLCEFSSSGVQGVGSLAVRYVWRAQQNGAWPVWISCAGVPHAEDLQVCGVDLEALPVVKTRTVDQGLRAAERMLRAAACEVVVVDVGGVNQAPMAMMGRLMKLAQRTQTACILLRTGVRADGSLCPLISLRVHVSQGHVDVHEERFCAVDAMRVRVEVVRDKARGRHDGFVLDYAMSPGLY